MARIELPAGEGMDVARALALAPHFVDVVVGYEKAVASSPLDPRLHELVRYRVAQLNDCALCLNSRRSGSGVDDDVLQQVADWATSPVFSPAERRALSFTEQFCTDSAAIGDDLLAALQDDLGPAGLADLALVVGKYLAMGRFMQVLGLDQACSVVL
jgi:alkylhydroperoxidase family enzyme